MKTILQSTKGWEHATGEMMDEKGDSKGKRREGERIQRKKTKGG